jgi:hypothetical protein
MADTAPASWTHEDSPSLGWKVSAPSWLVSLITHVLVLLLLALSYFRLEDPQIAQVLTALPAVEEDLPQVEDFAPQPLREINFDRETVAGGFTTLGQEAFGVPDVSASVPDVEVVDGDVSIEESFDLPGNPSAMPSRQPHGGPFSQRGPASRRGIPDGSSETAENAVSKALKWLIAHQEHDGSWNFDHRHGPCKTNPGTLVDADRGATGIVLLPLLGAGQTHKEGQYKQQVKAGLVYLVRNMKVHENKTADLVDTGNLYSHGIATIALCEAYAMTNDRELMAPAQAALDYIAYAQDPVGGGWRYSPRQPGDTSVVGWQLMALKSGHMAYLRVSPETVKGASKFLDSVEIDSGSAYGYTGPGDGQATSSIGLLCRMYLGWKHDHGALERGVARLSKIGPSKTNLYYNYYATQVLRHYGGEQWKAWNAVMRDQLVNSQATRGTEAGSWYIAGDHGSDRGGRIYCTSMATMILEVYYRHLPIYGKPAAEDDFPL